MELSPIVATLFSGGHILVIVVAMLLLFGGKKIPELMGGLGKGMKEFRKAMNETQDNEEDSKKKEIKK